MKKNRFFIFCFLLLFVFACKSENDASFEHSDPVANMEKSPAVFPVTDFLKGQLTELEGLPLTPLITIKNGNKIDSIWSKRENIRNFAEPFLKPTIDSNAMQAYYNSKSFFDQTIHAITFMYDANDELPGNITLTHFDVYVNPETNKVKRIYLVKKPTADSTIQLTWTVDKGCSIVTIVQAKGQNPVVSESKITWKFD